MPSNKRSSGRQPIVENDTIDQPNGNTPAEPSQETDARGGDQPAPTKAAEQPPAPRASEPPPRGEGGAPRSDAPAARHAESGGSRDEGGRGGGLDITHLKGKSNQQLTPNPKNPHRPG